MWPALDRPHRATWGLRNHWCSLPLGRWGNCDPVRAGLGLTQAGSPGSLFQGRPKGTLGTVPQTSQWLALGLHTAARRLQAAIPGSALQQGGGMLLYRQGN